MKSPGGVPSIPESFVDFDKEISVLLGRDLDGNLRFYPVAENEHRRRVLRTSRVPARTRSRISAEAGALGARIASASGHAGMLTIELGLGDDAEQASGLVESIAAALERNLSTSGVRRGADRG